MLLSGVPKSRCPIGVARAGDEVADDLLGGGVPYLEVVDAAFVGVDGFSSAEDEEVVSRLFCRPFADVLYSSIKFSVFGDIASIWISDLSKSEQIGGKRAK